MKPIKIASIFLAAAGLFLAIHSCNQGNEKKATEAPKKTDTIPPVAKEPVTQSGNLMLVRHSVASFQNWLNAYEAGDSLRLAYGLHSYGISRGVDDTNMVMVAIKMEDINKAKAFAALPLLKTNMEKAGVLGKPDIKYYNRQMLFLSTNDPSTRVMISHKVKDWEAWKKVYEEDKKARADAGLTDRSVGYEVDNDKMVIIVDVISDIQKARAFFASKELKAKMQAAGVEGAPDVFIYTLVKSYK